MSNQLVNYLRTHRQKWALTQGELAGLMGLKSPNTVSRYETSGRTPPLKAVMACEVIFGKAPKELFPGAFARVQEATLRNAAPLSKKIQWKRDPGSTKKKRLLARMTERADVNAKGL